MIKEILRQLLGPFRALIINIFINCKILAKHKTLKLSGKVIIRNSIFGEHNFLQGVTIKDSSLGDFSYVGKNTHIYNCEIGKYCCIAPNVNIGLGEHPVKKFVSIHPVFYTNTSYLGYTFGKENYFKEYYETSIGNDVWIGANVIIKGGVSIGNGAIIASGAVVTKDVPEYAIVGGIPAKFIKTRFEQNEMSFLREYKWWDKDTDFLKKNFRLFHDIKNFTDSKVK